MFNAIGTVSLWVHDQTEAHAFYTEKLGLETRADVSLAELGDFRWLTVGVPGQDLDVALMAIPGAPVFDDETAGQVRTLMGKGAAGTLFLATDDCRRDYEELKGARRRVLRGALGPPLRRRRRPARPLGQLDPPGAEHRLTPGVHGSGRSGLAGPPGRTSVGRRCSA